MKTFKLLILTTIAICLNNGLIAQPSPLDPVWGVYASGVGERLRPGMNPCWITYTVGLVDDPRIQNNVASGNMGVIMLGINWYQATEAQRRFSRYFNDQPDGIFKLTPCETTTTTTQTQTSQTGGGILNLPNVSGTWISEGRGRIVLTQSGSTISGSANGINPGDHWGEGHRNGGRITGRIENDGTVVIMNYWNDGTYSEDYMRLSGDGRTLSGTWNWYTDSSKVTSNGSGTYSIQRN